MKKVLCILISMVMTVATVTVAGCNGTEEPIDQVTVQLKWIHQAQFAGVYAADQKGFYAEENINVTIKPGGSDISLDQAVADLINGKSTFTIRGADEIIKARAEGNPIVTIVAIYQRNPWVYVSLKGAGIERIQDLVGKKIMVAPQALSQHYAVLDKLGIDPSSIELIPYEQSVDPVATDQVSAHLAYGTGPSLEYEYLGYEVSRIWLEDYGMSFYSDSIAATEELIQQNPELVERFLRATLKGWRYAIENQAEAVDMILQYDPSVDRGYQSIMIEALIPIIHTGKAEIGWMEDKVWQEMHQMLLDGGALTQPINVTEAYTMQFLEKIYGEAN